MFGALMTRFRSRPAATGPRIGQILRHQPTGRTAVVVAVIGTESVQPVLVGAVVGVCVQMAEAHPILRSLLHGVATSLNNIQFNPGAAILGDGTALQPSTPVDDEGKPVGDPVWPPAPWVLAGNVSKIKLTPWTPPAPEKSAPEESASGESASEAAQPPSTT